MLMTRRSTWDHRLTLGRGEGAMQRLGCGLEGRGVGWGEVIDFKLHIDKEEVLLVGPDSVTEVVLPWFWMGLHSLLKVVLVSTPDLALLLAKQVCQFQPYSKKKDLTPVTHALVTSSLDYCDMHHMGLPLEMAQEWQQLLQNVVAHILMASRFAHITPILWDLHWLHIIFKILVLTCKVLYSLGPGIGRIVSSNIIQRALHWFHQGGSSLCLVGWWGSASGTRTFSVVASWLWSSLPNSTHLAVSWVSFRCYAKMVLYMWDLVCFNCITVFILIWFDYSASCVGTVLDAKVGVEIQKIN